MFRILIVDDEPPALQALRLSLTASQPADTLVCAAGSAAQAMEAFRQAAFDLIICDIEMPGMSGIELLRWVQERYPQTQAVILTCHADFGYAQKALQLGTLEYILKPAQAAELCAAVEKARGIARKRHQTRDRQLEVLAARAGQYLRDVVTHTLGSHGERLRERAQQLELEPLTAGAWTPILLHIDGWHRPLSPEDMRLFQYGLCNSAQEMLAGGDVHGFTLTLDSENVLVLLHGVSPQAGGAFLPGACRQLITFCNRSLLHDLSCYLGRAVPLEALAAEVDRLQDFRRRHPMRHNHLHLVRPDEPAAMPRPAVPLEDVPWLELLAAHQEEQLAAQLLRPLEEQGAAPQDIFSLQQYQQDLMQALYSALQRSNIQANLLFRDQHSLALSQRALSSLEHFAQWLRWILDRAGETLREARESHTLTGRVKEYVASHIGEDLSRNAIANAMFLSPEYLSRLFHQETGVTLKDYILAQRVATAKHLLSGTQMPVSDIALALGYTSFSHFAKLFRDSTGLTPVEYRRAQGR